MLLNVRKCSVIHIGYRNPHTEYKVNGEALPKCEHIRDLGITISDTLKFSEHCSRTAANARKISGLMLRAFKSRSKSVMLPIYKGLIRPLLEYATPVWNPVFKMDIAELEGVQRQFTKRIKEARGESYVQRLQRLELPTLEQRRLYFDLVECHKVLHGTDVCSCTESLCLKTTNTRGHKLALIPPIARVLVHQHSFTHRVVNVWNALPANVVSLPLHSFKKAVREHVANNHALYDARPLCN
jgi:hypothetical protein